MPPPVSSSSTSTIVAETPVAAIDKRIPRTAATDCGPHIPPPSTIKNDECSHQNSTSTSRLFSSFAHTKTPSYVVTICILCNFFVEAGDFSVRDPFIWILEAILCDSIGRSRTRPAFPERLMRGSARLRVSRLICLCSSRPSSAPYRWVLWRTNMDGRRFCLWHMLGLFWQRPGCRSWVSLYHSVWIMQPVLGFVELRSKTITYVDRMLIIEF